MCGLAVQGKVQLHQYTPLSGLSNTYPSNGNLTNPNTMLSLFFVCLDCVVYARVPVHVCAGAYGCELAYGRPRGQGQYVFSTYLRCNISSESRAGYFV